MSYQVIARKWRPQAFEEVTGQEPITRTLRNAIEHERLHHAYLFSGARGVGKTTTARLLAKALNCHKSDGPTPTPCRVDDPVACASCKEISEGRSIDVLEIDAASNTGVDNVREAIIGSVAIAPARDRYKVFIIDEVHMLSGAAFNALLKTLEEPPPRVVFIMATTELHKLPDTILSRCQQFEFRTIATVKIVERLRLIADAEKVSVPEDALREIARAGEGSMRDAQSAFDQVISFSGAEIKAEDVETALGIASREMLARVVRAVAEHKPAEALAVVDDLVMRGHDLRNFCRDLLAHVRDLLVAKVSGEASEMLESSASDGRELAREAADFTESDLVRFFHSLTETESNLRAAAHPRYQLEIGLVKLIETRRLVPLSQLMERLAALEESLRTGRAPALKTTPAATGGGGGAPDAAGGKLPTPAGASNVSRKSSGASRPERETKDVAGAAQIDSGEPPFGGVGGSSQAGAPHGARPVAPPPPQSPPALTLVPPVTTPLASTHPSNPAGAATAARASLTPAAPSPAEEEAEVNQVGASVPAAGTAAGTFIENLKTALEKRRRMFLVTALDGAHSAGLDGRELAIEFAPAMKHLRDTLAKPDNVKILREVCRELLGHDVGVRINVSDAAAATAAEEGRPLSKQEQERHEKQELRQIAEQHPMVQQLLETFRGEIVDVKRVEEQ